jgi:hypothetical protein
VQTGADFSNYQDLINLGVRIRYPTQWW